MKCRICRFSKCSREILQLRFERDVGRWMMDGAYWWLIGEWAGVSLPLQTATINQTKQDKWLKFLVTKTKEEMRLLSCWEHGLINNWVWTNNLFFLCLSHDWLWERIMMCLLSLNYSGRIHHTVARLTFWTQHRRARFACTLAYERLYARTLHVTFWTLNRYSETNTHS